MKRDKEGQRRMRKAKEGQRRARKNEKGQGRARKREKGSGKHEIHETKIYARFKYRRGRKLRLIERKDPHREMKRE